MKSRDASSPGGSRRRGSGLWLASLAALWVALPAGADDSDSQESRKIDLTFKSPHYDAWVRPSIEGQTAMFGMANAWAGKAKENIGENTHGWGEFGLVPGVDAEVGLGGYGRLYGRLSGVLTVTTWGPDGAGSNVRGDNYNNPGEFTLEDFFIGWKSDDLVPSLGKDAFDLSFGSQDYQVGTGFIFYDGGSDGNRRGGFWLGLRTSFQLAGRARFETGHFKAEGLYLRARLKNTPANDIVTDLAGATFDYDFGELLGLELANVGVGYYNFFNADERSQDGLDVLDVRLDVKPLPVAKGLQFSGELVKEWNGSRNDSIGTYGEIGYDFGANDCAWKPYVSYRFAYFSGDGGGSNDNNFDPLFHGFSDWNYWFIGEISGEYVALNSNLMASIVRFRVNPTESLRAQLFWIYQRLDKLTDSITGRPPLGPKVATIDDKDLSHELNLILDYSFNEHLSFSMVAAVLVPLDGGEDFFGGGRTWFTYMFLASLQF